MPGKNPQNFERLKTLPPVEAVQTWLDGEFEIEEEPALVLAIQAGLPRKIGPDTIIKVLCKSLDDDDSAEDCFDKMMD